jgi:hypothetical protein
MNPRRLIQETIRRKERLERGEVTPARVTEITLAGPMSRLLTWW